LRAPDWLAYATAVLEKAGHDAKLLDMVAEAQDKSDLRRIAREAQADFVIFDSTTPSIYSDIECARIVKEESKAIVIMVGPHISALPEETLIKAAGAVDVACVGEYDYTVKDIIEHYPRLDGVTGIVYYSEGKTIRTAPRALIEDLDELPFPAWRHLDLMKYFDGGKLYPYIDIISGRGCPNACVFCLWPQVMHGMRYRLRSAANVVDEIERDIALCPAVSRSGEFFFEDDTFTVDKKRAIEICNEIARRKLKITFSVNARVDTADRELFRIMKTAGCRELLVGFESGSQAVLELMNKKVTLDKAYRFMEYAKEAGLDVNGCFVIGLPGETEETARETIKFALSLGLTTAQFSGAVPFPGTPFYDTAKREGWLKAKSYDAWLADGEQAGIVSYPELSSERINYYVDLGLKSFYFRPSYILRFFAINRSPADLYRKVRGGMNFMSYLFRKK
jgi:radical SAM superfamily enzyme YgiQ (UPF0313 family)